MVDDQQRRERPGEVSDEAGQDRSADADQGEDDAARPSSWGDLWQVPTIIISGLLILLGVYVAANRAPENDFGGALDQVEALMVRGKFELAGQQLTEVIEPNIHLATQAETARFHATAADWIYLSQAAQGMDQSTNNQRIAERYVKAVELGIGLDAARLERWANALISVGDIEGARRRLRDLDRLGDTAGQDVQGRRNRVLRSLVDRTLRSPDLSYDHMMEDLAAYRADPLLTVGDEIWAIGRQTRLRLEAGLTQEAIDRLMVDMRRLEGDLSPKDNAGFGELYTLLGRGYYDMGEYRHAEYYLQEAMARLDEADSVRGDALAGLGQIDVAQGRLDDAFERFDLVVQEYINTHSYLPGLLGRAAVRSMLGDYAGSLADYRRLRKLLASAGPRRDVNPERVAASLADRHDAALATGQVDVALSFIAIAEDLFEPAEAPARVLLRMASSSRQMADDLIGRAAGAGGEEPPDLADIDPAAWHEANGHYRRAGDFYIRHARVLVATATDDRGWSESLWLGGDSYDLGGWRDLAINHFQEYIGGHAVDDPRRNEATFRLAQAYHAELSYESAAQYYEQVIAEHPRSADASRSHVPLARCYLALGRPSEAQRQLQQVLAGERHLKPDALDYRDALIELGKLYYDSGEFATAIEQLDKAAKRYADDPRINEILYRLADSYRSQAAGIEEQKKIQRIMPRSQRDQLDALRVSHLETAKELFDEVSVRYEKLMKSKRLTPLQQDYLRWSFLYAADCAFTLDQHREAIGRYDKVARRYKDHHASMTALIQIVACYRRLGDTARARTAHDRALSRLKQLPDEAFSAPGTLMDRGAWQRWLENTPVGPSRSASAA